MSGQLRWMRKRAPLSPDCLQVGGSSVLPSTLTLIICVWPGLVPRGFQLHTQTLVVRASVQCGPLSRSFSLTLVFLSLPPLPALLLVLSPRSQRTAALLCCSRYLRARSGLCCVPCMLPADRLARAPSTCGAGGQKYAPARSSPTRVRGRPRRPALGRQAQPEGMS